MKLRERWDKFINSKPTKFETAFVYTSAVVTGVAFVTVVVLIILRVLHGDLYLF